MRTAEPPMICPSLLPTGGSSLSWCHLCRRPCYCCPHCCCRHEGLQAGDPPPVWLQLSTIPPPHPKSTATMPPPPPPPPPLPSPLLLLLPCHALPIILSLNCIAYFCALGAGFRVKCLCAAPCLALLPPCFPFFYSMGSCALPGPCLYIPVRGHLRTRKSTTRATWLHSCEAGGE